MRVVIAVDSFKHSMDAASVANAAAAGILAADKTSECIRVPLADGGEGTLDTLVKATGGKIYTAEVENPLGETIQAEYGILGDGKTSIVEMAQASGIELLCPDKRDPSRTSTRGTGQLILKALEHDVERIILTIGGSATNDCGAGMAEMLGYEFLDADGYCVSPVNGAALGRIKTIRISEDQRSALKKCSFEVACDVDNTLCGKNGASVTYAPQKGANGEMVKVLDNNLRKFSAVIRECLGVDISELPGSGAAGGLGGGAVAFLDAVTGPGFDLVSNVIGLESKIKNADLVITGEGMMDYQSAMGKAVSGVAKITKKYGIPAIGICGALGPGYEKLYAAGITSIFSIVPGPVSLETALKNGVKYTADTVERIMRLYGHK